MSHDIYFSAPPQVEAEEGELPSSVSYVYISFHNYDGYLVTTTAELELILQAARKAQERVVS